MSTTTPITRMKSRIHALEDVLGPDSRYPSEYYRLNQDCNKPERWHSHPDDVLNKNISTSEMEVVLFLQALIMVLKPMITVELGTNAGIFTEYAARVLPPKSRLISFEVDKDMYMHANVRLAQYGDDVMLINADAVTGGISWPKEAGVDFLFVDTGEFRISELRAWIPKLSQFGVCAVHDTDTRRYVRHETEIVAEEFKMQLLHLPTPRGLTLLRRAA